jgi:AraC-like DNA-binding protein
MQLKNDDLEKAREIKAFLEKNIREHYSYNDLVRKFGMNTFKLKRAFKAVAHENVYEHVIKIRIERAIYLLENSDKPINCIANTVGFDQTNFNIQFKKLTGITPSEWRKAPRPGDFSFITKTAG